MNDFGALFAQLFSLTQAIKDDSIRAFTLAMIERAPSAVWERPASTRHHLLDEREKFGNLLHSVRVASLCRVIADAVEVFADSDNSNIGADVLLSAAILHDMCRHGLFGLSESSRPDHPRLVRILADQCDLSCGHMDEIMEAVESHMGRWSTNPVVFEISASLALHLADCIVARWAEVIPGDSKESTVD